MEDIRGGFHFNILSGEAGNQGLKIVRRKFLSWFLQPKESTITLWLKDAEESEVITQLLLIP